MENGLASENDEEQGDFLNFGEDIVRLPTIKQPGTVELDFDRLLAPPLKLHEDLKNGCGGQLWPAGIVLANYILRKQRGSVQGKTIIELGAGGGLVGLAVARGCNGYRKPIYITDQEPMFELMGRNIKLNELQHEVKAAIYDWGTSTPPDLSAKPDIVLAADCVYFEPAFPLLQQTLQDLLGETTVCYFCFKKRRRADLQFVKTAKKMFELEEIDNYPDIEKHSREGIYLFEIRKKR